jgi:hypothetical protein
MNTSILDPLTNARQYVLDEPQALGAVIIISLTKVNGKKMVRMQITDVPTFDKDTKHLLKIPDFQPETHFLAAELDENNRVVHLKVNSIYPEPGEVLDLVEPSVVPDFYWIDSKVVLDEVKKGTLKAYEIEGQHGVFYSQLQLQEMCVKHADMIKSNKFKKYKTQKGFQKT